jgi:hypothetical protein
MNVQIGEAGHQIFAAPVYAHRVRGSFDFIRRPNLEDLPILNDHGLTREDQLSIHRRDVDIDERHDLVFVESRRLLRLSCAACVYLRTGRLNRWRPEIEEGQRQRADAEDDRHQHHGCQRIPFEPRPRTVYRNWQRSVHR